MNSNIKMIISLADLSKYPKHENITYSPTMIKAIANGGSSTLAMNGGVVGGISMKSTFDANNKPSANVCIPVKNQKWFRFRYFNWHLPFLAK